MVVMNGREVFKDRVIRYGRYNGRWMPVVVAFTAYRDPPKRNVKRMLPLVTCRFF